MIIDELLTFYKDSYFRSFLLRPQPFIVGILSFQKVKTRASISLYAKIILFKSLSTRIIYLPLKNELKIMIECAKEPDGALINGLTFQNFIVHAQLQLINL